MHFYAVRNIYGWQIFLSLPTTGTVNFGPCKSMTTKTIHIDLWSHAENTPKHPPAPGARQGDCAEDGAGIDAGVYEQHRGVIMLGKER